MPSPLPTEFAFSSNTTSAHSHHWWKCVLGLSVFCLSLYLIGAARYDLFTDDEIRYAEAGRRMLDSGDWIVPQYNGVPRYQKPILFYWMQALAQAVFGSTAWACRIPTALFGTALVLLTASLGRSLWGRNAGLWAGIGLAITTETILLSRMVLTDSLLLLFQQGAIAFFCWTQLENDAVRRRRLCRAMYLCIALGVLTKGPVGAVLPIAVIGGWLSFRRELFASWKQHRVLEGLLLIGAVTLPWYAAAHVATEGAYTQQFLLYENVQRFTSTVNDHRQSPLFYLVLFVPLTAPWCVFLPQALWWQLRRPTVSSSSFRDVAPRFFVWQMAFILFLFTFSQTKVWTYTALCVPPFALLVGRWLARFWDTACKSANKKRRPLQLGSIVIGVFCTAAAVGSWLLPMRALPAEVRDPQLLFAVRVCVGLLVPVCLLIFVVNRLASPRTTLTCWVGGHVLWFATVFLILVPSFDRVWNDPIRRIARDANSVPSMDVATYEVHELGLNFHLRVDRVEHYRKGHEAKVREVLSSKRPVLLVTRNDVIQELSGVPFYIWERGNRLVIGANIPRRKDDVAVHATTGERPPIR